MAKKTNIMQDYEGFVKKFEPKKTTDDCYTPPLVYEAVEKWVEQEYSLDRQDFVRPFWPGADYKSFEYDENSIVVDNPPFSIFAEIVRFYTEKNIKYFIFSPTLTIFSPNIEGCAIVTDVTITYENGAGINTSFYTNLEDSRFRIAPYLYKLVREADKLGSPKKQMPKYGYPKELITSSQVGRMSKYGVYFACPRSECEKVESLDSQEAYGKKIYGKGYLMSERMVAERMVAERMFATKRADDDRQVWELSDRERAIVKRLSNVQNMEEG